MRRGWYALGTVRNTQEQLLWGDCGFVLAPSWPNLPTIPIGNDGRARSDQGSDFPEADLIGIGVAVTRRPPSRPGEFRPEPRTEPDVVGIETRARRLGGEGFPCSLFRLRGGFTIPP
jgi:hypothetical protein